MMKYTLVEHEHLSSRFDRSRGSLDDYINTATRRCNIITKTEVGNNSRDDALRGHPNWGVAQVEGPNGVSECATVYDKRVYDLVRDPHAVLLAHEKGIGGEDSVQMAVSTYDTDRGRFKVGVYHGPARIEWPFGFRRTEPLEVRAHKEMMETLVAYMKRWEANNNLDGWMITGDINLNYRKLWVRKYLHQQIPTGVKINWDLGMPKTGGTHLPGNRIIDLTFYGKMKLIQTGLRPHHRSSDHVPFHDSYLL